MIENCTNRKKRVRKQINPKMNDENKTKSKYEEQKSRFLIRKVRLSKKENFYPMRNLEDILLIAGVIVGFSVFLILLDLFR